MEPEVKHGFFTMDAVTAVAKAHQMVQRAKTIKNLGLGMTNFLLAHPSENLKIIR